MADDRAELRLKRPRWLWIGLGELAALCVPVAAFGLGNVFYAELESVAGVLQVQAVLIGLFLGAVPLVLVHGVITARREEAVTAHPYGPVRLAIRLALYAQAGLTVFAAVALAPRSLFIPVWVFVCSAVAALLITVPLASLGGLLFQWVATERIDDPGRQETSDED